MQKDSGSFLLKKAKRYSYFKYTLSIIEAVYLFILLFLFASSGFSVALAKWLRALIPAGYLFLPFYLLVISFAYSALNFPLHYYHSYALEHKFSLSNQSFPGWLTDQLKSGLLSYAIVLILLYVFYFVLARSPGHWWLIVAGFWIFFSLVLAKITPLVIIPLFFKCRRISDEPLRRRILNLAQAMRVKVLDVFEIDFSKKTLKANAAFVGTGGTRRIILADTLKDKYTDEEIEVILAHELAHYRFKHLLKMVLINSLTTLAIFYLIFKTSAFALRLFGFSSLADFASLPLIFIYFLLFGAVIHPFQNYLSRMMERQADKEAVRVTGKKEVFINVMEKLSAQNLSDRSVHPLIKFFFFDHPPIDERIALAKSI